MHISPLTASDWEIIELHASFLETNFLSQIRCLPNPSASSAPHPLTLHLTPTSTANVIVTAIEPAQTSSQAFVKISPDAEVIVAPKVRERAGRTADSEAGRSIGGSTKGGRSSEGGRSSGRAKTIVHAPLFLRAVAREIVGDSFDESSSSDSGSDEVRSVADSAADEGLKIWLDSSHMLSKALKDITWVNVGIIHPAGLREPVDPQQPTQHQEQAPAQNVIARLCVWNDAPDSHHAALSTLLCSVLNFDGIVGGVVKLEPAPHQIAKANSIAGPAGGVKRLRITPFIPPSPAAGPAKQVGFQFGGESKAEKEEPTQRIRSLFGRTMLEGPLTDGMLIPSSSTWPGGILDFDPPPPADLTKLRTNWLLGADHRRLDITVQTPTPQPKSSHEPPGEPLPSSAPQLAGVDTVAQKTKQHILRSSSVLLTGGAGAGKTSLAQLLASELQQEFLYHITFLSCRALMGDELRVKSVKETLYRVFGLAAWGARGGGNALIVLDDTDGLCPAPTELEREGDGRSRMLSEVLCGVVREFASSNVVVLATARGRDEVNPVLLGAGGVGREVVEIGVLGREGRRNVLNMLMGVSGAPVGDLGGSNGTAESSAWMDGDSRPNTADGPPKTRRPTEAVQVDPNLDLLDVAGQTDGYLPGDLVLLASRARNEALMRTLASTTASHAVPALTAADFSAALKDFTPASLRGVTLHTSTTSFASIGGLHETRKVLLETLQYPTTYAPLFARSPLRLRSGLLLYGYPGCGKTLLASAVSAECGLNFISVKGPEILNKYIGASEKSVRDLFERAKAAKPCILFFDEFDSIAPRRGHDSTGVTDRVVNMLLTLMDGAEGLQGVYVLAATSRPDLIDPALLRPGRLDRSLECGMPDLREREDILAKVSAQLKVEAGVAWNGLAKRTEGYSGADLQALVYNAHLEAVHDLLDAEVPAKTVGQLDVAGDITRVERDMEFEYFHLGDLVRQKSKNGEGYSASASSVTAERAQIASKLATMQSRRRKQHRHTSASSDSANPANGTARQTAEPVITQRHLQKSLATTRASVSAEERRRLQKVYADFSGGRRKGAMEDGQGGSEIGGRSSLM